MNKRIDIIRNITIDALFLALILLFTYVPQIGYIQVMPTMAITTIHLVVLIGASLFGWKKALLYGLFFGLSSCLKAATAASSQFDTLFINPFISILPRVIFGLVSGLIIDLLKKRLTFKQFSICLPFTVCILTIFHTFIVLLSCYIFGILDIFGISKALGLADFVSGIRQTGFIIALTSATFIGALGESIASFIVVPAAFFALRTIPFVKQIDNHYKVKDARQDTKLETEHQ